MTGSTKLTQEAQRFICKSCGKAYIVRKCEAQDARSDAKFRFCSLCRKAFHSEQAKKQQKKEDLAWQAEKAKKQKEFETLLPHWTVRALSNVCPSKEALYIIGNGFDLMHGVKSSYYAFRDSLGKHSSLRMLLESFWTPEDIWADFENGLAHFDMNAMGSRMIVDNWLDIFDAYAEDASAASYAMAVESAASPMTQVCTELPKRFRRWIETLSIGTSDRPLRSLFSGGKVLSFNYTEFVETLYGIPTKDVCYIHGCRQQKHAKLVLGHRSGDSDTSYELREKPKKRKPTYRNGLIKMAQDQVFQIVSDCDDALTKDCASIINDHADFFDSLRHVKDIVVVGHSMSQVDWDYFKKVVSELEDVHTVTWHIGVHCLNDLQNMESLVRELGIEQKNIELFRTDTIRVSFFPAAAPAPAKKASPRTIAESSDGKWQAQMTESLFQMTDCGAKKVVYEVLLTSNVRKAFFDESGKRLFVIISGLNPGVMLFALRDDAWGLVNELEGIPNQGVLNRRLQKVLLNDKQITFVYNNRIRRYNLDNGILVENTAARNAASRDFSKGGADISKGFV